MPPDLRLNIPHLANAHASAIEPTAVTSQEIIEIVPTSASLVGSMMIPDPIIFTMVRIVSCTTPILLDLLIIFLLSAETAERRVV